MTTVRAEDKGRWRPPSAADVERIGRAVLAELPAPFRGHVRDVPVRVQDFADDATLKEMEIADAFDLLGLYRGVPVGQREGLTLPGGEPDMIFLYRRALLDFWCAESDLTLEEVVRHVLIHEIGHHFGLSDDDMQRIEDAAG